MNSRLYWPISLQIATATFSKIIVLHFLSEELVDVLCASSLSSHIKMRILSLLDEYLLYQQLMLVDRPPLPCYIKLTNNNQSPCHQLTSTLAKFELICKYRLLIDKQLQHQNSIYDNTFAGVFYPGTEHYSTSRGDTVIILAAGAGIHCASWFLYQYGIYL